MGLRKMRKFLSLISLLLLVAPLTTHAAAIQRVNVQQFEQILAAAHGQSDRKAANEFTNIMLTERASSVRLARWLSEFPGKHCREKLMLLADASAFLDLPAADIPTGAPPDIAAQKAMLLKTVEYINSTITRLPDFYATRKVEHFEDTPARPAVYNRGAGRNQGSALSTVETSYEPLHNTGHSIATISYVGGQELLGSKKGGNSLDKEPLALTSRGEFGAILVVVLLDSAKGRLTWGNWEPHANGANAVFRYTVRKGQSSYAVVLPHGITNKSLKPAYHGEIAIDPATGSIMRITVIADLEPPDEHAISSMMVEYGPVSIGGNSYICPVHSIALARVSIGDPLLATTPMQIQLNDVAYVDYHLFHAEARILTGADLKDDSGPTPPK